MFYGSEVGGQASRVARDFLTSTWATTRRGRVNLSFVSHRLVDVSRHLVSGCCQLRGGKGTHAKMFCAQSLKFHVCQLFGLRLRVAQSGSENMPSNLDEDVINDYNFICEKLPWSHL